MYNTLNSAIFHTFCFIQVILERAAVCLYNKLLIMIFCCKMNEIQAEREKGPDLGWIQLNKLFDKKFLRVISL